MEFQGIVFSILICMAITTLPSSASSSSSSSLVTFVFGDSLTEVGNNNYLQLSLAKANYPFYGIDFNGGKATGRFTNGRTIGDIISAKLGIQPPPPYLSLTPSDDAILRGVNYASGGAGILNDTGLYFIERLSFHDQINCFEKTKDAMKNKIGAEAANKLCNQALYFIGIGSNDYVNNFLQPFLSDGQQYTHDEFVGLLISTLGEQMTVRNFTNPVYLNHSLHISNNQSVNLILLACIDGRLSEDTRNVRGECDNRLTWDKYCVSREALQSWSKKNGIPWPRASGLHSFTEGEIKAWNMLETSELMGTRIQLKG
ncbi:hypothetical protein M9H77_34084 [Catharanthus roseus]|uniref:Uncharacterized protein n=1 Tax=Catharanthus roseus TaxID=4058 RepID=A0ACB9ZK99_CATRO|nr:hypothetical protein M9H77_34084 [Catharanthus roseus]